MGAFARTQAATVLAAPRAFTRMVDIPAHETPLQRAAREQEEMAQEAKRLQKLRTPKEQQTVGWFGVSQPQACETSYDCDRPMVCCDLLFTAVCCNGGMMIPTTDPIMQPQAIPIPVERDT